MTVIRILALIIGLSSLAGACGPGVGGAGAAVGAGAGAGAGHVVGEGLHVISVVGHGKCLYDEAEVRMADGSLRKVKNLEIGDRVLAYNKDRGVHASRVYVDFHNDNETTVAIFEIQTSTGRKIPVTAEHSLFVRRCLSDQNWTPKSAQDVRVGDCVPRFYAGDADVIEESVTNVRVFESKGIRQPVTETGTILVDDVVVSCYDRVVDQDATHMALLPHRWFAQLKNNYAQQLKSMLPSFFKLIGFFEMSLV
jgi:hypothetical protein